MRTIGLLLALVGGLSCGGESGGALAPLPPGGTRVLFVGNSLTYVDDLPRTLADLAASVGDTVRVAMAAGPDLALVDHVAGASDALPAIRRGGWALVVMQQGPSSRAVNRDTLVIGARALPGTATVAGARLAVPEATVRLLRRAAHETNVAQDVPCAA